MRHERLNTAAERTRAAGISDPEELDELERPVDTSDVKSIIAESVEATVRKTLCELDSTGDPLQVPGLPVPRERYSGSIVVRLTKRYKNAGPRDIRSLIKKALRHERKKRNKAWNTLVLSDAKQLEVESLAVLLSRACQPRRLVSCLKPCEIDALEQRANRTLLPPLHSLATYWRIEARHLAGRTAEGVVRLLNDLPEVDLAYRELAATDPRAPADPYAEHQYYLDRAPIGIDARWAWKQVGSSEDAGNGVQVIDLEQGWIEHQDLGPLGEPIIGDNRKTPHGTAVLGQLVAKHGNGGAVGIAPRSGFHLLSHFHADGNPGGTRGYVAEAILQALAEMNNGSELNLKQGDVLLIEVQRGFKPTEVDEADFDAIRLASAHGLIVVAAAGNGGVDLDAYRSDSGRAVFDRASTGFLDSGAILVGAAESAFPNNRARFSNFGSRLDCYASGDSVVTSGYGDLDGKDTDNYTQVFGGTSSAAPIVAGAALIVQSLNKARTGERLSPGQMREILSDPANGTPQGNSVPGRIGVMPDLRAVVESLALAPDVYLRSREGDTGEESSDQVTGSCPDVKVRETGEIEVVVRNRGLETCKVKVRVFRSEICVSNPAGNREEPVLSTLVPPGMRQDSLHPPLLAPAAPTQLSGPRWKLIAEAEEPVRIEPGNTANQITVPKKDGVDLAQPSSFLVLLDQEGEPPVALPPDPPYFRWEDFLAFNRRHARRSLIESSWSEALEDFYVIGAPDYPRVFDFEILQSLPKDVRATLSVTRLLAVSLWKDRLPPLSPEPTAAGGKVELNLPFQPRVSFSQVRLAAAVPYEATFTLQLDGTSSRTDLKAGHSIAIRQLFEGKEVGRITWRFRKNIPDSGDA